MNKHYISRETIHIKNVGPLHDTGNIEIRPLTVIIGDSASGKSTIMKIVILMRYIYKRINIRSYIKNAKVDDKVFYIRFKDLLRDDIRSIVNNNSYINYTFSINNHKYELRYEDGKLSNIDTIPNSDLLFAKEVWVSEMRSAIAPIISRGSFAKNASLGFFFDETFKDFDIATDRVNHFDLDYIGLQMNVVKGGNNQKKLMMKPNDDSYEPFELRNASSGIQTTAPLIAMVNFFSNEFSFKAAMKRNIIDFLYEKDLTTKYHPEIELADLPNLVQMHIEEPELSLDPTSQIRFINEIIRHSFLLKSKDRNVELMFATHSPYIINNLNLLLKAFDCGKSVDGASLDYNDVSVYLLQNGTICDLKIKNIHYINTDRLSEDINMIYNKYEDLNNEQQNEDSIGK